MQKLIYLADDEKDIREAIKIFLENTGYEVCAFADGKELLEAFNEKPADLVILDVMMPNLNGFACCKAIRSISYVPIFLLTARDSDLDYQTGLDLGCDDYFTKPISPMTIIMRIKSLFRRISYEREIALKQLEDKKTDDTI